MKVHDATEQAYKNGYEQGKKDAVKSGKWIVLSNKKSEVVINSGVWIDAWVIECPFCNSRYTVTNLIESPFYFCPRCGAKMDGEKEKEE